MSCKVFALTLPAIRWHVSYFDRLDNGDSDNYFLLDPIYDENEARREAAERLRDGWEVCFTEETVEQFVNDSCQHCTRVAIFECKMSRFQKLLASGRDAVEVQELLEQAVVIGLPYGEVAGYLASGWDEFSVIDSETKERHQAAGVLSITLDIAELFAEQAFWQARHRAVIGSRCN